MGQAIKIIDLVARKELKSEWQEHWVDSISLSPDGERLAVVLSTVNDSGRKDFLGFKFRNSLLTVYDFPSLKEKAKVSFDFPITSIKFSPDGKTIGLVKKLYKGAMPDHINHNFFDTWDLSFLDSTTLEVRHSLKGFSYPISYAFFNSNKDVIVGLKEKSPKDQNVFGGESVLATFDILTGERRNLIQTPRGPMRHIEFAAKEELFMAVDGHEVTQLLAYPGGEDRTDPEFRKAVGTSSSIAGTAFLRIFATFCKRKISKVRRTELGRICGTSSKEKWRSRTRNQAEFITPPVPSRRPASSSPSAAAGGEPTRQHYRFRRAAGIGLLRCPENSFFSSHCHWSRHAWR